MFCTVHARIPPQRGTGVKGMALTVTVYKTKTPPFLCEMALRSYLCLVLSVPQLFILRW